MFFTWLSGETFFSLLLWLHFSSLLAEQYRICEWEYFFSQYLSQNICNFSQIFAKALLSQFPWCSKGDLFFSVWIFSNENCVCWNSGVTKRNCFFLPLNFFSLASDGTKRFNFCHSYNGKLKMDFKSLNLNYFNYFCNSIGGDRIISILRASLPPLFP